MIKKLILPDALKDCSFCLPAPVVLPLWVVRLTYTRPHPWAGLYFLGYLCNKLLHN